MVDERVSTRADGVVTEQIVETKDNAPQDMTSDGGSGWLIGLLILAAIVLGVFYLMSINNDETAQIEAVGAAAQNVSQSVEKAVDGDKK